MTCYICDMTTRIRNGYLLKKPSVLLHKYSPLMCNKILDILWQEGYINGYKRECVYTEGNYFFFTKVYLKYSTNGVPAIQKIFNISTPGRRIYVSLETMQKINNSKGGFIISTSKGILFERDARFLNVGGQLLIGVY